MNSFIRTLFVLLVCLFTYSVSHADTLEETVHKDRFVKNIVLDGLDESAASLNLQINLIEHPRYVDSGEILPRCKILQLEDQITDNNIESLTPSVCNVDAEIFLNVPTGHFLQLSAKLPKPGAYKFEILWLPLFTKKALKLKHENKAQLNNNFQKQDIIITRSPAEQAFTISTVNNLNITKPWRLWPTSVGMIEKIESKEEVESKDDEVNPKNSNPTDNNEKTEGTFYLEVTSSNTLPIEEGLYYNIFCGTHNRHFLSHKLAPKPFDCAKHKNVKIGKHLPPLGTILEAVKIDNYGPVGKYKINVSMYDSNSYFTPQTTAIEVQIKEHWGTAATVIAIGLLIFSLLRRALQSTLEHNRYLRVIWQTEKNINMLIRDYNKTSKIAVVANQFINHLDNLKNEKKWLDNDSADLKIKTEVYSKLDDAFYIWLTAYNLFISKQVDREKLETIATTFGGDVTITQGKIDEFVATMQEIIKATKPEIQDRIKPSINSTLSKKDPERALDSLNGRYIGLRFFQILGVLLPIAIISGLLLFWAENATWGNEADIMKALIWGAGVNLFGPMVPTAWSSLMQKFVS